MGTCWSFAVLAKHHSISTWARDSVLCLILFFSAVALVSCWCKSNKISLLAQIRILMQEFICWSILEARCGMTPLKRPWWTSLTVPDPAAPVKSGSPVTRGGRCCPEAPQPCLQQATALLRWGRATWGDSVDVRSRVSGMPRAPALRSAGRAAVTVHVQICHCCCGSAALALSPLWDRGVCAAVERPGPMHLFLWPNPLASTGFCVFCVCQPWWL